MKDSFYGNLHTPRTMMKKYALFLIFFIQLAVLTAQQNNLKFKHIDLPTEVITNQVNCFLETKEGFLWMGSNEGLIRYDGYKTKRIPLTTKAGITMTTSYIIALLQGENDIIWIATTQGVFSYNQSSELITIPSHKILNSVNCRSLYKTKKGELLIGTNNGMHIYNPANNSVESFVHINGLELGLSNNIIRCIYEDSDGIIWIGTYDKLNKLDRKNNSFKSYNFQDKKAALFHQNNLILSITELDKNNTNKLLVGTETGKLLRVLNTNTSPIWSEISGPSFIGSISDIEYGDSENEIFVTFHNYGVSSIWYSSNAGVSWIDKEGDLPDFPVKAILYNPLALDEVIIGTELGVWKTENWKDASPSWQQTYNGMSDVKVTDLQYRKDGDMVLAATFGRGLFSGVFSNAPLSVESDIIVDKSLIVYPTISTGNFKVKSTENYNLVSFTVFNMAGEIVFKEKDISLSNGLPYSFSINTTPGVYIIKFLVNGESEVSKKVLIK